MSTPAPDPYLTAGWTTQHRHRTSAEPPHLEPDGSQDEDTPAARKGYAVVGERGPELIKPRRDTRPGGRQSASRHGSGAATVTG